MIVVFNTKQKVISVIGLIMTLTLPPNINVSILKNYQRVFQYVDSRLPRDLYYVVSFSRMMVNTAAILTDKQGNQ